MGRTVMPYSHVLETERERLRPFWRALSKEDQQAFDRLFDRAKMHTSEGFTCPIPGRWKPSFFPSAWNTGSLSRRSWEAQRWFMTGLRRDRPVANSDHKFGRRLSGKAGASLWNKPVAVDCGYKPPVGIVHPIVFQLIGQKAGVGIDPVFLWM